MLGPPPTEAEAEATAAEVAGVAVGGHLPTGQCECTAHSDGDSGSLHGT